MNTQHPPEGFLRNGSTVVLSDVPVWQGQTPLHSRGIIMNKGYVSHLHRLCIKPCSLMKFSLGCQVFYPPLVSSGP